MRRFQRAYSGTRQCHNLLIQHGVQTRQNALAAGFDRRFAGHKSPDMARVVQRAGNPRRQRTFGTYRHAQAAGIARRCIQLHLASRELQRFARATVHARIA